MRINSASSTLINLAKVLDQSVLKPTSTSKEVKAAAESSREKGFRALVVDPVYSGLAKSLLLNSKVLCASVCDFPHGRDTTNNRVSSVEKLIDIGVDEVDIVSKYHLLLEGKTKEFKDDLASVIGAVKGKVLKVILEVDYLSNEQIAQAVNCVCEVVKEKNANNIVVKTKTGFAPKKIENVQAVSIMKEALEKNGLYALNIDEIAHGKIGIKASGGMKTKEDVIPVLEKGAHIIGTSSGEDIIA